MAAVRLRSALVAAATLLAGCAWRPPDAPAPVAPAPAPMAPGAVAASAPVPAPDFAGVRYDCDGATFTLRFEDDYAVLDGLPGGTQRLGRDAGGVTPQQMVFSSPALRAEFGLGADERGATLQYLEPPSVLHCRRG